MSKNLAFDTSSARTTDENGYMHVSASHITKATVNPYYGYEIPGCEELGLDPEKIYYGLRDPAELQKSLDTWKGLPLHLEHHTDSAEDPQKEFRVGTVGTEIVWNKPYIDAPLTIWDQDAIDKINNNSFRELSCAYRYEPDFDSPGFYEGEKYDFVMRNIRGNHVALVEEGRAGHDVLVADNKPKSLNSNADNGMEHQKMASKAKSKAFKGAKDDNPVIEEKEMEIAEQTKELMEELQDLHDEQGGEVTDKEEGADGNEVIVALKDKYKISDEDLAALLESLKGAGAEDEDPEPTGDEGEDPDKEKTADDEDKTAAEDEECDKAQDEEPEKKPETTAQDRQLLKKRFEMAVDAKVAQIEKRIQSNYKARANAAVKVRPLIGNLDPFAFDSAAEIYKYVLNKKGVATAKYQPAAYSGMVDMLLMQHQPVKPQSFAEDGAADIDEHFKNLKNIRIGD